MPTTIMGDHAIALLQEEQHLVVPVVRAERPTMAENHWLSFAPVLVEDLDTVFGRDSRHESTLAARIVNGQRSADTNTLGGRQ